MLESLKEYFSSTINTAAQRVSNPVFGAFSISWCAFNWKSILYLLLSDSSIIDKITYISDNSSWKTVALYPCISVVILCGGLPWVNNLISAWQAKPLDNNDSIENHRKAKRILRSTRLQRLNAKHDVTYDKVKTGAEKDIQDMKEEIIKSKASMGELTSELKAKEEELRNANALLYDANNALKEETDKLDTMISAYKVAQNQFTEYKLKYPPQANLKLATTTNDAVSAFLNGTILNPTFSDLKNTGHGFGDSLKVNTGPSTKKDDNQA